MGGRSNDAIPVSEEELEELYGRAVRRDQRLANILPIDAWTGASAGQELRAARIRDFIEVPLPVLVVQRGAGGSTSQRHEVGPIKARSGG
jgi:hypothetical protein